MATQSSQKQYNEIGTIAAWTLGGLGATYLITKAIQWGLSPRCAPSAAKDVQEKPCDPEKHFGNGTRDAVDQASWESFPASDPPAY